MSAGRIVLIDCLVWAAWSAVVGVPAARMPVRLFERDSWFTRPRKLEHDGRVYERLRIRRWKDRLPDAGTWFGGRSKRRVGGGRDHLTVFAAETRRAETVHWLILAAAPVFVLWNPPGLFLAMVAYAAVANLPCIAIQRYNRARITRVLARRRRRGATVSTATVSTPSRSRAVGGSAS